MTEPVPIHPVVPDPRQTRGPVIDPVAGAWEILIEAREAGDDFIDKNEFDRSRAYDAHDRIVVGLGSAPDRDPATVTPVKLKAWISSMARDDRDAMELHSTLKILLAYAVWLGRRDPTLPSLSASGAHPAVPDEPTFLGPAVMAEYRCQASGGSTLSATEAMDLTAAVFGPRNGWSVVTQGVVERDWYQGLDPKTQSAFILRCKNIAEAFDHDMALWPRSIQPEEIIGWIDQQTQNDTVAAGYYVAFSRLLRSLDKQDWRLEVLSPSFTLPWSSGERAAGDDSEPA